MKKTGSYKSYFVFAGRPYTEWSSYSYQWEFLQPLWVCPALAFPHLGLPSQPHILSFALQVNTCTGIFRTTTPSVLGSEQLSHLLSLIHSRLRPVTLMASVHCPTNCRPDPYPLICFTAPPRIDLALLDVLQAENEIQTTWGTLKGDWTWETL